ncbi:MAG: outer membrane protein transport protein [Hyphomicrobiales bacterium]|nr:outer membrane protein transport protein [Hyphomicrobiales bacterium]
MSQRGGNRRARVTGVIFLAAVIGAPAAHATEGYFQAGYGARAKALAGSGAADSRDAMSLSINPAGLVDVPSQLNMGVSLFAPYRGYNVSGPGAIAPGFLPGSFKVDSSRNVFGIPYFGYSRRITPDSAWGIAVYGNGGMNTTYRSPANVNCPPGAFGVFCGGKTGVDLNQLFITVGYARSFGNVSVGIAPVFAFQMFKAYGLLPFAPLSANGGALSNRNYDTSMGFGVRAGVQWKVSNTVRIGIAGSTPMWMEAFSKYSGLFADGGKFNIPANITAGIAWDATPDLTLMLDYKRIFYSGVGAVSNASNIPSPFGAAGGPGFGWRDVDVISIGAEWRVDPKWTLRAGYAHNTNPIRSRDVTLNLLAPGVVTDHFTAGVNYKITPHSSIDLSAMFAPTSKVSGIEVTPPPPFGAGVNPGRRVTLRMHQFEVTVGYNYKFGGGAAPVMAKY